MVKVADLEKQCAVLQEKLTNVDNKKQELEKKIASESSLSQDQMRKNKETTANEKKQMQREIEKLRVKSYEQELELVETQANYDKDMALWQGKVQFLEQQREQQKLELNESQTKFDIITQKFVQSRAADKEEAESSQNAFVSRLEQKYLNQMQELKDQNRFAIIETEERRKKLEKENRRLNETLNDIQNNQTGSSLAVDRKVREQQENEKRYQDEILLIKKDRDNQLLELARKMDHERESLRMKVFETEQRLKESENKRQMFVFELEKEKTRWNIEKDRYISKQNEFLEQIDKLEKKKELQTRDNDKLQNDLRAVKKGNQNSMMNIMGMGARKNDVNFNTERSFASGQNNLRNHDDYYK